MSEQLSYENFDSSIASGVSVVKFSSAGCGPCRTYAPMFAKFGETHPEVKCFDMDAFDYPEVTSKYNIRYVPVTIVFKNGVEVKREGGILTVEKLEVLTNV